MQVNIKICKYYTYRSFLQVNLSSLRSSRKHEKNSTESYNYFFSLDSQHITVSKILMICMDLTIDIVISSCITSLSNIFVFSLELQSGVPVLS